MTSQTKRLIDGVEAGGGRVNHLCLVGKEGEGQVREWRTKF